MPWLRPVIWLKALRLTSPWNHALIRGAHPPVQMALINAGVVKVIAAMVDPNPQVSGRGLAILKEAGVEVQSGLMEQQALALNPGFVSRMARKRPFVRLKLAGSMDGRTAMADGNSVWITGPEARQDVQRLRAQADAIITGSGTVLADNPSLNVRYEVPGFICPARKTAASHHFG